jgi:glycosyltransferase involved in cell wall biosynthesis
VGDIRKIVAEENRSYIAKAGSVEALAGVLSELARDPSLRSRIGQENREKAVRLFDQSQMVQRYADLYASALGDKWKDPF